MMKVTIKRVRILFAEAAIAFGQEGLIALLRRAFVFLSKPFFRYGTYYLFEVAVENTDNLNEADFMPEVNGLTFRVVSTREQADELEGNGVHYHWRRFNWRDRVDSGAIAFCTVVGEEPAHIMWVAPSEKAKDCMGQLPFRVDFSNGEYCGSSWTNPKYRRKGFARYTTLKAVRFLRQWGMTTNRYTVAKRNVASLGVSDQFGSKKCADARYLKLLWWESWKEKPVDSRRAPDG